MATIKYMGMEATQEVARFVNAKLAFASAMPVSPIDGQLVLYTGTTTADYTLGGVYRYSATDSEWELINFTQPIILTYAEFLELPQAVQESGHFIVEDYPGVDGGGTIEGYYNSTDGKFYEDDQYTTEIPGEAGMLYVGLDNDTIYRYDETNDEFIAVGGGNGTVIKYVETLPVSGIENIIYGYDSVTSNAEITADGFLDTDDNFVKTGNTYVAKIGIYVEASSDGVNYDEFDSLEYDDTNSEFILTYADGLTDIIAVGSTFYWKVDARLYYAGDEEHQTLTLLASSGGGSHYLPGEGIDITNSIISIIPSSVDSLGGVKPDGVTTIVSANGTISGNYRGGYGIKVDGNEISTKTFTGTQAEWNALTPTQQAEFDTVNITDDSSTVNNTAGHTVMSDSGSGFPQRTNLQFEGATVTDDSTNDKTKVTVTPYTAGDKIDITNHEISVDESVKTTFIGTKAEWEVLSSADKAKYDLVNLTDDQSGVTTVVDTVADGNMNPVTSNAVYDALSGINDKLAKRLRSLTNGESTTYSISGYCHAVIIIIGSSVKSFIPVYSNWNGTVSSVGTIGTTTGFTIAASGSTITLENTSGYDIYPYVLVLNGTFEEQI